MNNNYDVGIIGAGVAGTFAALRISQFHKDTKTIVFDLGRKWAKRRRQIDGWLGCLPNSDGKFYLSDIDKVSQLTGLRKAKSAHTWFNKVLSNVGDFKVTKDKAPFVSLSKKLSKLDYNLTLNDYVQTYPKDIHSLSKYIASIVEQNRNITFYFDTEVVTIHRQKSVFIVSSENQEFRCKKLIFAVGRSGWRWAKDVYANFGIIESNDIAKFGIRVEMNETLLKDFNKSSCTISKENDWELGPFCWNGTVIPEDHIDTAISAFRSNENRWKSDKVSFNLIGSRKFENNGFEQTDRLAKLTFIITNDRVIKEKTSTLLNGKSKVSILPEYDWLKNTLAEISLVIPEITTKAYFHVPTIVPLPPPINVGTDLSTELDNFYVAGETAGVTGLLSAACMGIISADSVCK